MLSQVGVNAFIAGLMDYFFILVFCLIGSIIKDTYNTLTDKEYKIQFKKILISTLFSSIILFSLSDYILSRMDWKLFILPCFIGGTVGFESIEKLSNLRFWVKFLINKRDAVNDLIQKENRNIVSNRHCKKEDIEIDDHG